MNTQLKEKIKTIDAQQLEVLVNEHKRIWEGARKKYNKAEQDMKSAFIHRCDAVIETCDADGKCTLDNINTRLKFGPAGEWSPSTYVAKIARGSARFQFYAWVRYWTEKKKTYLLTEKIDTSDYNELDNVFSHYQHLMLKEAEKESLVNVAISAYNDILSACNENLQYNTISPRAYYVMELCENDSKQSNEVNNPAGLVSQVFGHFHIST